MIFRIDAEIDIVVYRQKLLTFLHSALTKLNILVALNTGLNEKQAPDTELIFLSHWKTKHSSCLVALNTGLNEKQASDTELIFLSHWKTKHSSCLVALNTGLNEK